MIIKRGEIEYFNVKLWILIGRIFFDYTFIRYNWRIKKWIIQPVIYDVNYLNKYIYNRIYRLGGIWFISILNL